jgi:hypothetical protein
LIDIEQLRVSGRSDWFIRGVIDGFRGWNSSRPRPPSLKVRSLPGGRIEISGKISRRKKHLERLGGKLSRAGQGWIFPASALAKLKKDRELNKVGDLWSGISDEDLGSAHLEYSEGYAWVQEKLFRMPRMNIARR